jgi:quercetin dioxygenase-like cupin family protein
VDDLQVYLKLKERIEGRPYTAGPQIPVQLTRGSRMHVAPEDLRAVRQDGMVIRFETLGAMAYVLAEIPTTGSTGTTLEQACERPHWGFVVDGELTYVAAGQRLSIPAGRAFHVPAGGHEHRFEASGSALIAGFEPIEPDLDVSDERLVAQGFQPTKQPVRATSVPVLSPSSVPIGDIRIESWRMAPYVMTRVAMGERSGYTSGWCDVPHWGMVTAGQLAIEWEDDVEILSKGDIFHCPAGPPGHRLEAADPVTLIDLTPIENLESGGRVAEWRRATVRSARGRSRGIAVAALG